MTARRALAAEEVNGVYQVAEGAELIPYRLARTAGRRLRVMLQVKQHDSTLLWLVEIGDSGEVFYFVDGAARPKEYD